MKQSVLGIGLFALYAFVFGPAGVAPIGLYHVGVATLIAVAYLADAALHSSSLIMRHPLAGLNVLAVMAGTLAFFWYAMYGPNEIFLVFIGTLVSMILSMLLVFTPALASRRGRLH